MGGGVRFAVCGLRFAECGVWSVECGVSDLLVNKTSGKGQVCDGASVPGQQSFHAPRSLDVVDSVVYSLVPWFRFLPADRETSLLFFGKTRGVAFIFSLPDKSVGGNLPDSTSACSYESHRMSEFACLRCVPAYILIR